MNSYQHFTIVWPCIVTDSLWIKPTDALNSNFIGITTLHVSGSLSTHHQEFLAVNRLWYILSSCDDRLLPEVWWNAVPSYSYSWSSQLPKMYQSRCTAKNSWWWVERLPETCRVVIPIKLEFSASVGFIRKLPTCLSLLWAVSRTLKYRTPKKNVLIFLVLRCEGIRFNSWIIVNQFALKRKSFSDQCINLLRTTDRRAYGYPYRSRHSIYATPT